MDEALVEHKLLETAAGGGTAAEKALTALGGGRRGQDGFQAQDCEEAASPVGSPSINLCWNTLKSSIRSIVVLRLHHSQRRRQRKSSARGYTAGV